MTEAEVKKFIGEKYWPTFGQWISGQTVGVNDDGTIDYYSSDVEAFKSKIEKHYDRQKDPEGWD